MNRILTQYPATRLRPLKKARDGATNIIVNTDGTLSVQTYEGETAPVLPGNAYGTYTTKVDISSSGVTNLNSTPITIIPNPGTGAFIEPISAVMYLHSATSAFTTNTSLVLQKDTVSSPLFTLNIADSPSVAGAMRTIQPVYPLSGNTNIAPNKPLNLWCSTGNPSGGDGALTLWVTYKIVSL